MIRRLSRRRGLELIAGGAGALLAGPLCASAEHAAAHDLTALQNAVRGKVVVRGTGDYDNIRHRMVWNPRVADLRLPDAIVQVTSPQDVAAAIKFARAHGLKIAVRSGGHNYQGAVLRNSGLLIVLSGLKPVCVAEG
ncbi:MAG TPA: FAD-binding protein, partial [Steroidobacteraceae bacterium]